MTATSARESPFTLDSSRSRDFRLYWLAGGVNLLGSQASGLVLPLVALAISGSPTAAGLVGGVGLAGRLVTAPVAGVLADRLPRKAMMVTALLVAAGAIGMVTATLAAGAATLAVLTGAAFVEGWPRPATNRPARVPSVECCPPTTSRHWPGSKRATTPCGSPGQCSGARFSRWRAGCRS